MSSTIEQLGTDAFREQHRVISAELDEIASELDTIRARGGGWRDATGTLRRLLVLLECDVERHAEEEEHQLYVPLERAKGGHSPALAECYAEHGALRLGVERLRHDLVTAPSHPGADAALFEDCDRLIGLLRVHMAREDEVLFLAAEQALDRSELGGRPAAAGGGPS